MKQDDVEISTKENDKIDKLVDYVLNEKEGIIKYWNSKPCAIPRKLKEIIFTDIVSIEVMGKRELFMVVDSNLGKLWAMVVWSASVFDKETIEKSVNGILPRFLPKIKLDPQISPEEIKKEYLLNKELASKKELFNAIRKDSFEECKLVLSNVLDDCKCLTCDIEETSSYNLKISVKYDGYIFDDWCLNYSLPDADVITNENDLKQAYKVFNSDSKKSFLKRLNKTFEFSYNKDYEVFKSNPTIHKSKYQMVNLNYVVKLTPKPYGFTKTTDDYRFDEYGTLIWKDDKINKYVKEINTDKFKECYAFAEHKLKVLKDEGYSIERKTKDGLMSGKGDFLIKKDNKELRFSLNIAPYKRKTDEWKQGISDFVDSILNGFKDTTAKLEKAKTNLMLNDIYSLLEVDLSSIVVEIENVDLDSLTKSLCNENCSIHYLNDQKRNILNKTKGKYEGFYTPEEIAEVITSMSKRDIIRKRYVDEWGYREQHGGYYQVYKLKKASEVAVLKNRVYTFDREAIEQKCKERPEDLTDFELDYALMQIQNKKEKTLPDYLVLAKSLTNKGFVANRKEEMIDILKDSPDMIKTLLKGVLSREETKGIQEVISKILEGSKS